VIEREEALSGGAMLDRGIVRVGETVRRPWDVWSSSVHAVLEHLANAEFVEAPKFLGRDEQGREVLTFLEGEDSGWPLRPHFLTDQGAFELGCLVRRLGQALSSYAPADDAVWQFAVGTPAEGQALQHGDLGPWNIVWSGEKVSGIIDWDFLHPGDPDFDLGYLAWTAVPFMSDERAAIKGFPDVPDRSARAHAFADGAEVAPSRLIKAVLDAQVTQAQRIDSLGVQGAEPWRTFRDRGLGEDAFQDVAWSRRERWQERLAG
jgi:phosphotransferase family enzyme